MTFWQGFLIGRWTKQSSSSPGFFAGLFAMMFVLAVASIICYWFLIAVPIAVLCLIITWCKTHNFGAVKMTLTLLAVAMLMILIAALIIFMLYLLFSTIPVLLWIGILLTIGFCLPLVIKCLVMIVQIWQR